MKKNSIILFLGFILLLASCQAPSPLNTLKSDLNKYPEYSIGLEDMREEGTFFHDYYHRYKIVYATQVNATDSLSYFTENTDWLPVPQKVYQDNLNFLGMTIASKTQKKGIDDKAKPPGYQYVGDARYGQWRKDNQGNSFWEFYGKFAFFSYMFGAFRRPVYQRDFNDYRRYRGNNQPYYGRNSEYGTRGKYTQTTHKSFFERRKARETARKSRFSRRVNQRNTRSGMSGMRQRSGGFGK
jgi:hypothetical protein